MKIFFADKPSGLTTHTSLNHNDRKSALAELNDGFKEHLATRSGEDLRVVHRLDRETTGAIAFARDRTVAARIGALFETRSVHKTYLFLSDRSIDHERSEIESYIERRGNLFVSSPGTTQHPANSRTVFTRLECSQGLTLWQAEPESGKPHQIRLHAEALGIPILGDELHGGSPFPALCLHSWKLRFELDGELYHHVSPPPVWFRRRDLALDKRLIKWLCAIDRRERLLRSYGESAQDPDLTLRWIHSEGDPLRVEQLGSVYWLSWYADQPPSSEEWLSLESLLKECNWQKWYLQVRGDRGRAPNQELVRLSTEAPPIRWTAKENGLVFSFRRDSGLSPGLFLDQRRNRSWVLNNSNGSKVLNLFCYTGGFSVCAAAGGAQKVVSVDLSRPFLDRAKENFALNSLSSTDHEFRAIDSREYLAWAAKKKLLFDLVICDPPSFGRSKSGVFRFERDFNGLIRQLAAVTAPGGVILFATNFEGWDIDTFTERASCGLETHSMAIRPTPSPDLDFELPRQNRNMKSAFFVSRKSDPGS